MTVRMENLPKDQRHVRQLEGGGTRERRQGVCPRLNRGDHEKNVSTKRWGKRGGGEKGGRRENRDIPHSQGETTAITQKILLNRSEQKVKRGLGSRKNVQRKENRDGQKVLGEKETKTTKS